MTNVRRILLRDILTNQNGEALQNANVYVFLGDTGAAVDPPTGTAVSGSIYAAETGGPALTNPMTTTNNQGEFTLWFTIPQKVDVVFTDNTDAAYYASTPLTVIPFTTFLEQYIIAPRNAAYTAGTDRHEQGVAYPAASITYESPQFVFLDAQVGSDTYPVGRRGTHDYPYANPGTIISDADYYDAGGAGKRRPVYVWVRGSPYVSSIPSATGPPPTYTVTPDQVFQTATQLVSPKGWTWNFGMADLASEVVSSLIIPTNAFPNDKALFITGQMGTLIGGMFTNTQTGGMGVQIGGQQTRIIGTACYMNDSHGFLATSFSDDMRVLEKVQANQNGQSGTGYGIAIMSDGSHSPNLLTIKESEVSTSVGSGNILLQRDTGQSGGHTVLIEKCRLHGSKVKVDIQGYNDVTIRNNYGEPSTTMNAPYIRVRCANGGTAATVADWVSGLRLEGNSWHGSSNNGAYLASTTTSGATGTGTTANNITDTSTFPTPPFLVLFQDQTNSEYMWVTSLTATTLTGVRGVGRLGPAFSHAVGKTVRVVGGVHYDVDSCTGGSFADSHFGSSSSYAINLPMILFGANTDSNFLDLRNMYNLDTRATYLGDPAVIAPTLAEVPAASLLGDVGYITLPATTPRNWGIYHDATSLRLLQGGQDMGSYP